MSRSQSGALVVGLPHQSPSFPTRHQYEVVPRVATGSPRKNFSKAPGITSTSWSSMLNRLMAMLSSRKRISKESPCPSRPSNTCSPSSQLGFHEYRRPSHSGDAIASSTAMAWHRRRSSGVLSVKNPPTGCPFWCCCCLKCSASAVGVGVDKR